VTIVAIIALRDRRNGTDDP